MSAFTPPPGYPRIKIVHSFEELLSTPFGEDINALCWQRDLPGDFAEVIEKLAVGEGITTLDDERLLSLPLSPAGRIAIEVLLEDQRRLRAHDLAPSLDCINGYLRDEDPGPVPTDVYSFHVDSATVEADTYLCTYQGASSQGLRNDHAQRRIDIPATRAELLHLYGGQDDEAFTEHLQENCYDLHYLPLGSPTSEADTIFTFGLHNLWRIATAYPGSPVPPCIHRAPETAPGDPVRLLLIS